MSKQKPNPMGELRTRIRQAGLRCTTARLTVLLRLHEAKTPMSHAEIAADLATSGFDKATIYRNLVEMAEAGLISRMELGDHVWRFEYRGEAQAHGGEHPHFVCVDCGEVSCLPDSSVNVAPSPGSRGSVIGELTEVLLKGRCGRCV